MIQKDLFRKDLYFRLSVRVQIPSLNRRREDNLPIVKHFLMEFSRKLEKKLTSISQEAGDVLKKFDWQGNEAKAAQLLHLNHHTFRYRRRKLGILKSLAGVFLPFSESFFFFLAGNFEILL